MKFSVVIPTHNRAEALRVTLSALAEQGYPPDQYEVIVVEDGSTGDTSNIANEQFPFRLRYFWQTHQGAAAARNSGAQRSSGDILIFLDDDITVEPQFIAGIAQEHASYDRVVVMGTFRPYLTPQDTPFRSVAALAEPHGNEPDDGGFVSFTTCTSNNLSVRREDYFAIGMMQDPTDGAWWPNWDDIDFAYRAHCQGFPFRRSPVAICYHRDHSIDDLETYCRRLDRAARAAVLLFQKFPGLREHIPMFEDKGFISWGVDSPDLVARKVLRSVVSAKPSLWGLNRLTWLVERVCPRPLLLRPLYRWVVGAYIFNGYRQALGEYGEESVLSRSEVKSPVEKESER